MIAPTSFERVKMIANSAKGFLYCVSSLDVTGIRQNISTDINEMICEVKKISNIPCALGFGISTAAQANSSGDRGKWKLWRNQLDCKCLKLHEKSRKSYYLHLVFDEKGNFTKNKKAVSYWAIPSFLLQLKLFLLLVPVSILRLCLFCFDYTNTILCLYLFRINAWTYFRIFCQFAQNLHKDLYVFVVH